MKEYSGAVLFIDLLGFGYLTGTPDSIDADDFKSHGFPMQSVSNQMFSAHTLAKFRKHLIVHRNTYENVRVSQLSDCAFIWSTDSDLILEFSRELMWRLALDGILCRAGIAYGQILEPDKQARSIGDYICGSAVTNAVANENSGKGARIFVDDEFPSKCTTKFPDAFKPRVSKVDYKAADEFCWYLYPNDIANASRSVLKTNQSERCRSIIELVGFFIYSPKFAWNSKTKLGLIQLACTIDIISSTYNELDIGPPIAHSFEIIMAKENIRGRGNLNSYILAMCKDL